MHALNNRIIPEICQEQGCLKTIHFETEKIHLSKAGVYLKFYDSLFKKVIKLSDDSEENFENIEPSGENEEKNEDRENKQSPVIMK